MTSSTSCLGICLWKFANQTSAEHAGTTIIAKTSKNVAKMNAVEQVFHPNSRSLFIGAHGFDDTVVMYDVISRNIVARTPSLGTCTTSMVLSKSGRYLFAAGKNGDLRVWKTNTTPGPAAWVEPTRMGAQEVDVPFVEVARIPFQDEIYKICLSQEDHRLVVAYKSKFGCSLAVVDLDKEMVE
jgi:WD40 repeat protein